MYPIRPAILFIRKISENSLLVGVEVGVSAGDTSQTILENLYMKKLYLVDLWEPFLQKGILVHTFVPCYKKVVERFKQCVNVEILKGCSKDVVSKIPNNLDFVYIDACHEYENVKEDILSWYPKIRVGGVLSGHDYSPVNVWPGVSKAVNEFVNENNYDLHTAIVDNSPERNNCDWWIVKR